MHKILLYRQMLSRLGIIKKITGTLLQHEQKYSKIATNFGATQRSGEFLCDHVLLTKPNLLFFFNALLCLNFKADCIMICMMNIHTLQTVISRCLTNQSQYSGAPLTPPSCKMLHNLWHLYTLTNIFSCVLIRKSSHTAYY